MSDLLYEILDVEQNSPEWLEARAGRVTGSCASHVMSKLLPSGGEAAGKSDYRLQLAIERITGKPQLDDFQNRYTRHGHEFEPLARVAVEQETGLVFRETGFLKRKDKLIGSSLDGDALGMKILLELKCPKPTTHMGYLSADKLPAAYRHQVVHNLYVSGADSCIFASYCEAMPEGLELFTKMVRAKDLPLEEYETKLDEFLVTVEIMQETVIRLQQRRLALKK